MKRRNLILALAVFITLILGGALWLNINTSRNQQMADVLTRIDALERTVQALQIRTYSKPNDETNDKSRTTEEIVDQSDLAKITERLDHAESLLTGLIENSSVKKQDTTNVVENTNVPINQSAQYYQQRLQHLETAIELLQNQFDAMFQSISPVADLGSPEAELSRANRYYQELDEPSTAVQAYTSLLERYDLTYVETLTALSNSSHAFDEAAQKHPSFAENNTSLLLLLEERISRLRHEDQGATYSRLADGCLKGGCYEDAYRLYHKAIQTLPDGKDKVSAYWSMSFAARQAVGEEAFFETLSKGHKLGSDLGIDVSEFEKEIAEPREKD